MRLSIVHQIAVCTVALLTPTSVLAGSISVTEEAAPNIVVEAQDGSVKQVLDELGKRYGFKVDYASPTDTTAAVTGRWAGPPKTIVARLLKLQDHIVIQSADTPAGIGRIVLLPKTHSDALVATASGAHEPVSTEPAVTTVATPPTDSDVNKAKADKKAANSQLAGQPASLPGAGIANKHAESMAKQFAGGNPASTQPTDTATLTAQVAGDSQRLAESLKAICPTGTCGTRR